MLWALEPRLEEEESSVGQSGRLGLGKALPSPEPNARLLLPVLPVLRNGGRRGLSSLTRLHSSDMSVASDDDELPSDADDDVDADEDDDKLGVESARAAWRKLASAPSSRRVCVRSVVVVGDDDQGEGAAW